MDKFTRQEAVEAHVLQFALVYVFGSNYEVTSCGKPLKAISEFFNFVSTYFWGIPFKTVSKSDGISTRKKVMKPVSALAEAIGLKK
jgi:hypothetical protein